MTIFENKNECCGCGVCALSCPKKCITMTDDDEGFAYPQIEQEKCSDCGLCKKMCSFQNAKCEEKEGYPLVYAAKHKDNDVRTASSSGGAFTAFSDWILDNGGSVFGVKFDENLTAVAACANTKKERDLFCGSKYMQSELRNSFAEVKDLLQCEKIVMFSGTPCQNAALKSYLKDTDTSNLFLCDFVCHGVPTQKIFKDFIKFLENKIGKRIVKYFCRYKSDDVNWSHTECQIDEGNRHYYYSYYKNIFYSHNAIRRCCYNCKYANKHREADVTIADYWGIERFMPDFADYKGVSLILVNSDKGRKWFDNINENFEIRQSNIADASFGNLMLRKPASLPPTREKFWSDYHNNGFEYIAKKYGRAGFKGKCKALAKKILVKLGLFEFAKKVLGRS